MLFICLLRIFFLSTFRLCPPHPLHSLYLSDSFFLSSSSSVSSYMQLSLFLNRSLYFCQRLSLNLSISPSLSFSLSLSLFSSISIILSPLSLSSIRFHLSIYQNGSIRLFFCTSVNKMYSLIKALLVHNT